MKANTKYQKEFSNYLNIIGEALKKNDFKAYDVAKEMLDESVEECKHENRLMKEMKTSNFGVLNHIFETELPNLIKSNKKGVKAVIKTIKEDKNLLGEFNFYNTIKNQYPEEVSKVVSPETVILKLMESIEINQDTINESNKKLRKVMLENNIVPSSFIDTESKKLYENGHVILSTKKAPNNVIKLAESFKNVERYMDTHKKQISESKSLETLVEEFENKLKDTLTESEMSFVQQITDFRSPIAEKRKEKLFNTLKEDCLKVVNTMLSEDASNNELSGLKTQLEGLTFSNETIVKDIAKLLEIRDILMDD